MIKMHIMHILFLNYQLFECGDRKPKKCPQLHRLSARRPQTSSRGSSLSLCVTRSRSASTGPTPRSAIASCTVP